jgi:3',5'-cyclic-AMP phosphodiesterase
MDRFIHLTDLHVSHPDSGDPGLHTDTPATLRHVVALVNAMDPAPDFLVASGDLTNRGDPESYRLVQQAFEALDIPVVLALGNHDSRSGFHTVFGNGPSEQPHFHAAAHGGLHVITLDTGVPGRVAGAICEAQFEFLRRTIRARPDLPKLIVMHHPPWLDPNGLPWASLDGDSTDRLARTLKGHDIVGILSGHIHINQVNHWHGIPVVISNGQHSTVDLLERQDLRIVEGTGFGICVWRDSGMSVSFVPLSPAAGEITRIDQKRLRAFS